MKKYVDENPYISDIRDRFGAVKIGYRGFLRKLSKSDEQALKDMVRELVDLGLKKPEDEEQADNLRKEITGYLAKFNPDLKIAMKNLAGRRKLI